MNKVIWFKCAPDKRSMVRVGIFKQNNIEVHFGVYGSLDKCSVLTSYPRRRFITVREQAIETAMESTEMWISELMPYIYEGDEEIVKDWVIK